MPLWVCLTCLLDDEMMPSDACAADGGDGVRDNAATARLRRTPMSITVRIPTPLRKITQDEDVVTAEGGTLLELIADLDTHYPGMRARLLDESGEIRRFVNVFVNGEDVRFLSGLETSVATNDEVSIVPAVAGGARD